MSSDSSGNRYIAFRVDADRSPIDLNIHQLSALLVSLAGTQKAPLVGRFDGGGAVNQPQPATAEML